MARILEFDHLGIVEMVQPAIPFGVRSPAVRPVKQQCRRRDRGPGLVLELVRHIFHAPYVQMRVELPAVGAVLVLVHAVQRQMARLVFGEELVLLDHPAKGRLDAFVFARDAARCGAFLADPFGHPLGVRRFALLGLPRRARAEPFDRHDLAHHVGKGPGITQGDVSAHRMAHDRHRPPVELVDELGKVIDHVVGHVIAVADPVGIAMPAVIESGDVPVPAQVFRHPVPAARMIAPAMHQHQRRRVAIAPIDIIESQALRYEGLRCRSGV